MRVVIETVDHQSQRYDTCGDWEITYEATMGADGTVVEVPTIAIKVSDMGDWRKEFLVGIHEAIEAALCVEDGVTDAQVSPFDIAFEAARASSTEPDGRFQFQGRFYDADYEPGDSPDAPYQHQHNFATAVERMACAAFGMKWAEYEDAVMGLPEWKGTP